MRRVASPERSDRHEVSAPPSTMSTACREFVDVAGRTCQKLGIPLSTGQIYGLLYLSPRPLALEDIAEVLKISKASVSTGARHLLGWQAVKQVWVPGDRRDHYEALGDLRELVRTAYRQLFLSKLEKAGRKVDSILCALDADKRDGAVTKEEHAFCRERLQKLAELEHRVRRLLPVVEKLL
jgi:HTH-type transcriptional regulator, glycine betaine synthesis regulator